MKEAQPIVFDPVHRPCKCAPCCYKRMLRMLHDLDQEYGPEHVADPTTSDAAFLRSTSIVPYDPLAEVTAERFDVEQATYAYSRRLDQERVIRRRRDLMFAVCVLGLLSYVASLFWRGGQ